MSTLFDKENAMAQVAEAEIVHDTPVQAAQPPAVVDQQGALLAMIERVALNPEVPIERMLQLLDMKERLDASQARKAFDLAISMAKAEIPPIVKSRTVDFTGKTGVRTNYRHEDLAGIAKVVDPILGKYGLSYRYRTAQQGNQITVTCVVSHRDGYSEETTLSGGHDQSGNKNDFQAVGSAVSYLQRYTLKAALGLAAAHDDDAGKASTDAGTISPEQFIALRDLLQQSGSDEARFLRFFKIEMLEEMPVARFGEADKLLRQKIAEKGTQ